MTLSLPMPLTYKMKTVNYNGDREVCEFNFIAFFWCLFLNEHEIWRGNNSSAMFSSAIVVGYFDSVQHDVVDHINSNGKLRYSTIQWLNCWYGYSTSNSKSNVVLNIYWTMKFYLKANMELTLMLLVS